MVLYIDIVIQRILLTLVLNVINNYRSIGKKMNYFQVTVEEKTDP